MNFYKLIKHLEERHLDVMRYPSIQLGKDVISFPLWNLSGALCGWQQYRPDADKKDKNNPREGRYFTYVSGDKQSKAICVWGLESFHYRNDVLFVVEGVFDACRLHNHGIPAIAVLNSSDKRFREWIGSLGREIYKVEDGHGSKLGSYPNMEIPEHREDLGDMEDVEIVEALNVLGVSSEYIT